MSVHLSPILPATRDAILVGDPRRAFALGQSLTVQPEMSHLSRGLWGYRGVTERGLELTVQATGVGGPSAVAVICDLAGMGVERMVRLGTCTAVGRDAAGERIEPGRCFLVSTARCGDGASRALNGGEPAVEPDSALFQALEGIAGPAEVLSRDLVLRMDRLVPAARDRGEEAAGPPGPPGQAPLRDLQTAATLAAARKLGVAAAAILVVAEDESGQRIAEAELEKLFEPVATAVADVLESFSNPQLEG